MPEAVILHKLCFYREGGSEKNMRAIRGMLAVSGEDIDLPLLTRAMNSLGLDDSWRTAQAESSHYMAAAVAES